MIKEGYFDKTIIFRVVTRNSYSHIKILTLINSILCLGNMYDTDPTTH